MTVHRIRYRRPEAPWSLSLMTTPDAKEAAVQIGRLTALGYRVEDVLPPLVGDGAESTHPVRLNER